MTYLGTQPNDVKKNTGLYTPSEILQLEKDGHWGGSLELIEEQTVSGVSQVDFTSIKQNVYDVLLLQYNNFIPTVDGSSLRMRSSKALSVPKLYGNPTINSTKSLTKMTLRPNSQTSRSFFRALSSLPRIPEMTVLTESSI